MDEHVRRAVTLGLRRLGIDVVTVQEDGLTGADDVAVLDRAQALGRVAFTQDRDFLVEAARRQQAQLPFAGIVYAHQQVVGIGQCIHELELLAGVYDPPDMADTVVHLPL
jgi:hypothetical protein